jgi:hypothetical protein
MGYVVQVDPDVLAARARRLAQAAATLDTLAGRVLALCGGAGAFTGGGQLGATLEETGRAAARTIGQAASVVDDLGTRTGLAGEDYRSLEHALTSRPAPAGVVVAPAAASGTPAAEVAG